MKQARSGFGRQMRGDARGTRRAAVLVLLVVAALGGPARADAPIVWPDVSAPPQAGARRPGPGDAALLVAVERYAELPPVPGALRNATDWQAFLTAGRGLGPESVTLLRDNEATLEKIRKFARKAAATVRPGGTLWVVFIGHGAPAADGKDGLLVGYDAQQDADSVFARSLPQQELLSLVQGGKQARTVMVLDACFSGRATDGKPLVKGLQPLVVLTGAVNKAALGSALILSAAKSNQFAGPLPGADRPAFSYLVLGGLRGWADQDGNGQVTAREVRDYSQKVLMATVKDRSQEPQLVATRPDEVLGPAFEKAPDLAALQRRGGGAPAAGAPARRDDRMVTVAVAEFRTNGLPGDMTWMGRSFADATLGRLSKGRAVRVVEREFLDQIAAELKLQKSSMVDERTAVTMGRLLGARLFVFGSVSSLADAVVVRARIVSVERGEVLDTVEAEGGRQALLALQRDVGNKIAAAMAVEVALAPGTGLEMGEVGVTALADLEHLRELARTLPLVGLDPARNRRRAEYMMAIGMADRLLAVAPRLPAAHLYRGLFALQSEDLARARAEAQAAVQLAGDDAEALFLRGNAALVAHDDAGALGAFYEMARKLPDDARAWYGAGRVLLGLNRRGEAAAMFLEAAVRQPAIADLEGNLRTLLGGPDGLAVVDELRTVRPNIYPAGVVYTAYWRRDFAQSEAFAANAATQTPGFYLAHFMLGMAARARGNGQLAAAAFQQALALRPSFPDVHRELGRLLLASNQCGLGAAHVRLYLHASNYVDDYAALEQAIAACTGTDSDN